jgi:hypothetical protein
MFDDVRKLEELFNSYTFGASTITDNPAVDGNKASICCFCSRCETWILALFWQWNCVVTAGVAGRHVELWSSER